MRKPVRFAVFFGLPVPFPPNLTIYPPNLTGLLTDFVKIVVNVKTALLSSAVRFRKSVMGSKLPMLRKT